MKCLAAIFLLSLSLAAPTLADTFEVSGQTNVPACQSIDITCSPVEFSAILTATPGYNAYGNVFDVTSLTGTFDNQFPMAGGGGFLATSRLLPIANPLSPSGLNFTENGEEWGIGFDQAFGTGSVFMLGETGGYAFVNWNIEPVATPEPPTFLLAVLGLCAIVTFNWKKTFLLLQN